MALALLLAGCAAPSAGLAGRVVADGRSLAGAKVRVQDMAGAVRGEATSGPDGGYALGPLPAGSYRVWAETAGPPPLVAVSGRSPLRLAPGASAWVGLQAVPREEPAWRPMPEAQAGFGALSGVVRWEGKPLEGAVVYAYLDDREALKGPGFRQSFPSGPAGRYALDELPEGTYFVAARRRKDAATSGPVREGDLYGAAFANPVGVRSGQETILDLHVVRKERDEDPNEDLIALYGTGLRGRVVDEAGKPVAGVLVFAYRDRTIGHGMPDFVTVPTGPDGVFALPLGEGGLFYVGSRERPGGSPAPGERFGLYEGTPDHGIIVRKNRIVEGVVLVVRKVLEP